MTTEGMPERLFIRRTHCDGKHFSAVSPSSPLACTRTQYTSTSWLIDRLEGMKLARRHLQELDSRAARSLDKQVEIYNAAIDAVIALVREG